MSSPPASPDEVNEGNGLHPDHTGEGQVSALTIDLNALDLVEDAVKRVKENGGVVGVIGALESDHHGHDQDTAQSLSRLRDTLERVDKLRNTFTVLHEGAARAHTLARRNLAYITNKDGIARLPDEVLSRIFTIFCGYDHRGESENAEEVSVIASVCMRFRLIALSLSQLWTRISNHMPLEGVDKHLVRSATRPLVIDDYWIPSKDKLLKEAQFHNMILSHAQRWESLSLRYFECDETALKALTSNLEGLHLPMLRELIMDFPDSHFLGREEEEPEDVNLHIYLAWDAPSLKVFQISNFIPRAFNYVLLDSCNIELGTFGWCRPLDPLDTLMTFLTSQFFLEEFNFTVISFPDESNFPVGRPVLLPGLERMVLQIHWGMWDTYQPQGAGDYIEDQTNFVIPKILSSLMVPALEYVYVDFILTAEIARTFQFCDLFSSLTWFECLETLKIAMHHTRNFKYELAPFSFIFSKMPILRHLYLEIHDSDVSGAVPSRSSQDFVEPPPLRTIHLVNCRYFSEDSLCAVIWFLSQGESWAEFEELRVTDCALLGNCADALSRWLDPDKVMIENEEDGDVYGL